MNAKMLGVALLSGSFLFGCTATTTDDNIQWDSKSTSEIEQHQVTLSTTMWINKMPMIDADPIAPLHGSLLLSSDSEIPADLSVESIWVRHGNESLKINEGEFEMMALSDLQWQVSFKQSPHFAEDVSSLDIAIQLKSDNQVIWLTEQGVDVDIVY